MFAELEANNRQDQGGRKHGNTVAIAHAAVVLIIHRLYINLLIGLGLLTSIQFNSIQCYFILFYFILFSYIVTRLACHCN